MRSTRARHWASDRREANENRLGITWKAPSGRFVQVRAAAGHHGAPGAASRGLEISGGVLHPVVPSSVDRCHCLRDIRVWLCRPFAELFGIPGRQNDISVYRYCGNASFMAEKDSTPFECSGLLEGLDWQAWRSGQRCGAQGEYDSFAVVHPYPRKKRSRRTEWPHDKSNFLEASAGGWNCIMRRALHGRELRIRRTWRSRASD